MSRQVLFTDFDGTLTDVEFCELALERMDSALDENPVAEHVAGRITLFEVQRRIFGAMWIWPGPVLAPTEIAFDVHRSTSFWQTKDEAAIRATASTTWPTRFWHPQSLTERPMIERAPSTTIVVPEM